MKVEYKFESAEANGLARKYFYFGDKLVGIGEDSSPRQAKIKAAQ